LPAGAEPRERARAPGPGTADAKAVAVERKHRLRVVGLRRDRQGRPVVRLVEPGPLTAVGAEAIRGAVALRGYRHAAAVASRIVAVRAQPHRVAATFGRDVLDLGQAELLALVDVHRAGQSHREQR